MKLKSPIPASALSSVLRQILLDGPHAHGRTYADLPPHDELRRLFRDHGAALKQTRPRRRLWFEDRDFFIRTLRGEE